MENSLVGLKVPDFEIASTGTRTFKLSDSLGRALVLYFYPKDNTPGCTTEGAAVSRSARAFCGSGCAILRHFSRQLAGRTRAFRSKMGFPFDLLSDADEAICTLFGVMKMKNMYGKQVRGIERSTFVIDARGMVAREWRGVKVPGHVQEVLEFVKTL